MTERLNIEPVPSHDVITSIGRITVDWTNANLMRHYDPYNNYLEYNDGETLHQLNVLDRDWDKLVADDFPWEYWPNLEHFSVNEIIKVNVGGTGYEFHPSNTKLRIFKDSEYDHAEHQLRPGDTRGFKLKEGLKKMLFKGDYPIRYLPYVDELSRNWYGGITKKGGTP